MGTEPTLRLSTLVPDRPVVEIASSLHPDGRKYEFRTRDELSLEQLTDLEVMGERSEELAKKMEGGDKLSSADARLLGDWTEQMLALAFHTELEPEVVKELTQQQRIQVMDAFTTASLTPTPNRGARRATSKKRTGAK